MAHGDHAGHQIIRQLHATSTLDLHASDAEGGWAILIANSERFAEIKFRIHADFPLKQGYLTFSQFAGRLVIDHVNQKIVLFRIFVPDNTINFDTKWKTSPTGRGHITDAGRCRHVELVSGHDSVVDAIQWDERLSADKAELVLARKFYPAWKIDWQPIGKAHELAKLFNKPIHIVSADGPFKDESC